jgi:hypothetical protein
MANKTVLMEITTRQQSFPLGTPEEPFLFELFDKNDFRMSFVETTSPGASFPEVPEAINYTARVTKNGVMLEQKFDIPLTEAVFGVPDTFTVTFS